MLEIYYTLRQKQVTEVILNLKDGYIESEKLISLMGFSESGSQKIDSSKDV